jgi:cell division protein ZapA
MDEKENIITIKILDRSYQIKCPPEQRYELQESAQIVDDQMRKIRHAGNASTTDRIAVVAALNLCQEYLALKKHQTQYIESMHQRLQDLQTKIQNFLVTEQEIAV